MAEKAYFGDGFRVIFYRKVVESDQNVGSGTESGIENKNSNAETKMSSIESSTQKQKSGIENQLRALIIQHPEITQQEAAEILGYSKSWIRRIMKKMQQEGILCREGSTKKGYWIVMQ